MQLRRIDAVIGARRDADARAAIDDVPVERHLHFERMTHGLGDALRVARAAARHHDRELVGADPRDAVARAADHRAQSRGDLAQHQIADPVAERIVDVRELIEIHHEHGHGRARARAAPAIDCSSRSTKSTRVGRPVSASRWASSVIRCTDDATAFLHRAKRSGELADLVLARAHGNGLVVARCNAMRGGREIANRPGNAAREEHADDACSEDAERRHDGELVAASRGRARARLVSAAAARRPRRHRTAGRGSSRASPRHRRTPRCPRRWCSRIGWRRRLSRAPSVSGSASVLAASFQVAFVLTARGTKLRGR